LYTAAYVNIYKSCFEISALTSFDSIIKSFARTNDDKIRLDYFFQTLILFSL